MCPTPHLSPILYTTSGVSQVCNSWPHSFLAFFNYLPSVLPPDGTVLFADDTTIFLFGNNCTLLSSSLQSCLNLAIRWMTNNGLKLNADITKYMIICSPKTRVEPPPLHIHLSGSEIEQVSSFKPVGVLVNDTLTWTNHISHVATRVGRGVNLLRCLSWFLPRSLLVLYLKSYILPLVDYCNVAWDICTPHDSPPLQFFFHYACHLALQCPHHSSSSALLKKLSSYGAIL